jgi:hypothetical protein
MIAVAAIEYRSYFDIVTHGYTTWRAAGGPACIAIGGIALNVTVRLWFPPGQRRDVRMLLAMTLAACVLSTLTSFAFLYSTWHEYRVLSAEYVAHEYRVVSGTVSNFVPEAPGPNGHRSERFQVAGVNFEYSSYLLTSAFHQTARAGGPIHDGARVQIGEVNGAIVSLALDE